MATVSTNRPGGEAARVPAHAVSGWRDGWFVVPWDVTFRELDGIGHVNNAVFFTYFEWARTQYWFALTGGNKALDIGFIVARAECDFRQQLAMEPIEIRTRISEMRNTSFVFRGEIYRDHGRELAAAGDTVVVLYDWNEAKKMPLDGELRERIRLFQGGRVN